MKHLNNFKIFEATWLDEVILAQNFNTQFIEDILIDLKDMEFRINIVKCLLNKSFNRMSKKTDAFSSNYYLSYIITLNPSTYHKDISEYIERSEHIKYALLSLDKEYHCRVAANSYTNGSLVIYCVDLNEKFDNRRIIFDTKKKEIIKNSILSYKERIGIHNKIVRTELQVDNNPKSKSYKKESLIIIPINPKYNIEMVKDIIRKSLRDPIDRGYVKISDYVYYPIVSSDDYDNDAIPSLKLEIN